HPVQPVGTARHLDHALTDGDEAFAHAHNLPGKDPVMPRPIASGNHQLLAAMVSPQKGESVMARLSSSTLPPAGEAVRLPAYDRGGITPGVVHLGIGAFHRAHMAVYVDDLLADHPDWGIVGASLRRPDTRDALLPQD